MIARYLQVSYHDRNFLPDAIWEVAAQNLPQLIEALPPRSTDRKTIENALEIVEKFPSVPQVLVQPLIFAAIDERGKIGARAQKLLQDVAGIDDQLIALLTDKRQGVRANAARLLAARGAETALPAMAKRLKTEKSDLARAELISAISTLGGDTEPYLGAAAQRKTWISATLVESSRRTTLV